MVFNLGREGKGQASNCWGTTSPMRYCMTMCCMIGLFYTGRHLAGVKCLSAAHDCPFRKRILQLPRGQVKTLFLMSCGLICLYSMSFLVFLIVWWGWLAVEFGYPMNKQRNSKTGERNNLSEFTGILHTLFSKYQICLVFPVQGRLQHWLKLYQWTV